MAVTLVMFTQDEERREFSVKPKSILGRERGCNIQIPLSVVSRRHCELEFKDEKLTVRDLGSSNGTFVNNARVQESELKAGDTLTVGPVIFTVVINGLPAEIKPIQSIVKKKKKRKSSKAETGKLKDETGSVDLSGGSSIDVKQGSGDKGSIDAGSVDLLKDDSDEIPLGEISLEDDLDGSKADPLAELEAIAKQRKGTRES